MGRLAPLLLAALCALAAAAPWSFSEATPEPSAAPAADVPEVSDSPAAVATPVASPPVETPEATAPPPPPPVVSTPEPTREPTPEPVPLTDCERQCVALKLNPEWVDLQCDPFKALIPAPRMHSTCRIGFALEAVTTACKTACNDCELCINPGQIVATPALQHTEIAVCSRFRRALPAELHGMCVLGVRGAAALGCAAALRFHGKDGHWHDHNATVVAVHGDSIESLVNPYRELLDRQAAELATFLATPRGDTIVRSVKTGDAGLPQPKRPPNFEPPTPAQPPKAHTPPQAPAATLEAAPVVPVAEAAAPLADAPVAQVEPTLTPVAPQAVAEDAAPAPPSEPAPPAASEPAPPAEPAAVAPAEPAAPAAEPVPAEPSPATAPAEPAPAQEPAPAEPVVPAQEATPVTPPVPDAPAPAAPASPSIPSTRTRARRRKGENKQG